MHRAADRESGLWTSWGSALRLLAGWLSVTIGMRNLLVEADRTTGTPDRAYLLFHAVLVAGGILLLGAPTLGGVAGWVHGPRARLGEPPTTDGGTVGALP